MPLTALLILAASTFVPAPHDPLPQLQPGQGIVLKAPRLVTVTFAGYEFQDQVETFGGFLASSQWLKAIGAEYGVGAASNVNVRIPGDPPAALDSSSLTELLKERINDGTLPAPDANTLYVVYFSTRTWFYKNLLVCPSKYGHAQGTGISFQGTRFAWVAAPDCLGDFDELTRQTSTIVADAVVDPFLDSYRMIIPAPATLPQALGAGESCSGRIDAVGGSGQVTVTESNYKLGRSWSNAAAARGDDPCVPATTDPAGVYQSVSAAPSPAQTVPAGGTATFALTGWSAAPAGPWTIMPIILQGSFVPAVTLDTAAMSNGGHATLTVTVPADAQSGQIGVVVIRSSPHRSYVYLSVVAR